ncbi:MAG: DUF1801 domain-containing protein [Gemmatimonadaceae bacterium]
MTVDQYLDQLADDRRDAVMGVRKVIRKHLPKGYHEIVGYGMLMYSIPLADYPDTYNNQPLCYVALAAHKNYCSLYMMSCYGYAPHLEKLKAAFKAEGKKLDMGKSCVRFRSPDDLPLRTIGELVASMPPATWIEIYEQSRRR